MGKEISQENGAQRWSSQRDWILYTLLLGFRIVLCPFLPGYVHPDEFFQGGQELWFGCPPFVPWEFEPEHALRSVAPPTVMTWMPLQAYAWATGTSMYALSGREILVIPRIFCALLSVLTVDLSVWCLTATFSRKRAPTASLLVVATAWPTCVLLNRPFTNALETMLLALLLLCTNTASQRYRIDLIAGILCAIALFTRFTFVFVAFPSMMRYLVNKLSLSPSSALFGIAIVGISFLGTAAAIVYADVLYYSSDGGDSWASFVAPLNALLYNSQVENLKEHGLHPRWTHVLVNMMLLFGPLTVIVYVMLGRRVWSLFRKSTTKCKDETSLTRIRSTCLWTLLSGLCFLSMAPHQEPRFILPLLAPLAILSEQYYNSTWFKAVWALFNVILFLLFGVLHQGGVMPSLMSVSNVLSAPTDLPRAVFYYHTYMPPTFASRMRISHTTPCNAEREFCNSECSIESLSCIINVPIVDLKGSSAESLLVAIEESLSSGSKVESKTKERVYLVSPPIRMGDVVIYPNECSLGTSFSCERVESHWPHLTTEDFPPFEGSIRNVLSNFNLGIYEITCA
jgi:phosphatidylinositol glycan class Z